MTTPRRHPAGRRKWTTALAILGGALTFGRITAEAAPPVLARVDITGPVTAIALPAHAHLSDARGQEYLLVYAAVDQLTDSGLRFQILATNASPEDHVLARRLQPAGHDQPAPPGRVVYGDGHQYLVNATPGEVEALAGAGFALARLPHDPLRWQRPAAAGPGTPAPLPRQQTAARDPLVAEMLDRVQAPRLSAILRRLTGIAPEVAGGNLTRFATRYSNSGPPIQAATCFAFDHLRALGYAVEFHDWHAGRNVVGTLPGGARSNEVVILVAHLDSVPAGTLAPGADDNGSGTAGVLLAAEILRQFQFERTLRVLLVTGEEQGLLGSAAYAARASAAGDNIVAVLNLDMIAWDSNSDGVMDLYTRSVSSPGYPADLSIVEAFTNVAAQYALATPLAPRIIADSNVWESDHSRFWNVGYPAVLAIEAHRSGPLRDFNAYYHTTNDTLAHFNMPYFTSFVRAALGTAAHLAGPTARVPVDVVEVAHTPAAPDCGIGTATFLARHEAGAVETGPDPLDEPVAAPAATNASWLDLQTQPYGTPLRVDSRPAASETRFACTLTASAVDGAPLSCSNRLRFDFLTPPRTNRLYLVRLRIPGRHTAASSDFTCVTNLRDVVAGGGYVDLPALANVSNGMPYGTCEIAARFLDRTPAGTALSLVSLSGSHALLAARAQVGTRVSDRIEGSTNLVQTNGWRLLESVTHAVTPVDASFEDGWTSVATPVDASSLTNAPNGYFRFSRQWLDP